MTPMTCKCQFCLDRISTEAPYRDLDFAEMPATKSDVAGVHRTFERIHGVLRLILWSMVFIAISQLAQCAGAMLPRS